MAEPTPARTGLQVEGVSHLFGERAVVDDASFTVAPAEIFCLLGPSGCGKTTLLRIIAGLETLQKGRVVVNGRVMADAAAVNVPPEDRSMTLLFQDFALFPHLTVMQNVAFGLSDLDPEIRRERSLEVLGQVGMLGHADRYPHELSGGEQQRIALARARAPRPRVMMLDEPFSNLDVSLRSQLRDLVLHVIKRTVASTVIVTHDPEEAMFMGDRIAVMREGRILQVGTPEELYDQPESAFVAELFSDVNRIRGIVRDGRIETTLGDVAADGFADGTEVEALVRPDSLVLGPVEDGVASGTVLAARMLGESSLVHLGVRQGGGAEDLHLHVRIPGRPRPREGNTVGIRLDADRVFVFPVVAGKR
jgi:iron(III) transport system ATP-binding protein